MFDISSGYVENLFVKVSRVLHINIETNKVFPLTISVEFFCSSSPCFCSTTSSNFCWSHVSIVSGMQYKSSNIYKRVPIFTRVFLYLVNILFSFLFFFFWRGGESLYLVRTYFWGGWLLEGILRLKMGTLYVQVKYTGFTW